MPDISVIVPTHNVGLWVGECVDSILRQEGASIEVLVIDDGSTDDTVQIVEGIARRDARVRLVAALGSGGAQARDQGVELARGEYIAFVDGDDIVPRDAYRAMIGSARRSGSDLVVGRFFKYHLGKTWHPTRKWRAFDAAREGITLSDEPSLISNRACWNRLFRRQWWIDEAIRFPSVPRSNDIVPMTKALTSAQSIDVITDIVYIYRDRPGNTSMSSRAGAAASLESYLSQEVECRSLVKSVPSSALLDEYDDLVIARDGWVHLRKFLLGAGWVGVDPDSLHRIESWVSRIVELVGSKAIAGADTNVRWAWSLVAMGDWEGAARIAGALQDLPKQRKWPRPEVWLAQAERLVEADCAPRDVLRAGLAEHVLDPISSGLEPQSIELSVALARSMSTIGELFVGDGGYGATAEQQQVALMLREGAIGLEPPALPHVAMEAIFNAGEEVTLHLAVTGEPAEILGVSLARAGHRDELAIKRGEGGKLVARYPVARLGAEPVSVFASIKTQFGVVYEQVRIEAAHVASEPEGPLFVVTRLGELCTVRADDDSVGGDPKRFMHDYLSAGVTEATIVGDELRLTVRPERESTITALRFWREVNESVMSRGFACRTESDGRVSATRKARDVLNRRWMLMATFRTPLGLVEFPVQVPRDAVKDAGKENEAPIHVIRVWGTSGLQVVATRATRGRASISGVGAYGLRSVVHRLRNRARRIRALVTGRA
ncbi:glycosyltransferase family 2 protein [Microbacterium hominis]|uniref:Glycosyltransferase family 2 protein n=1 Tax=Microbacterium hominis TaxID=162426 RepID=A0A7D4PVA2_9MICO|nr:glycosyltransferase family 2 protein [Microbacterium hominis]QKJ20353.1 glycosyltransferase family 2 protein [Microbacterium hominis]